ncbi:MAG TPA: SGNH/GDSL hydrolase family protein [Alphaproteobacteria bacterium]|nr:SGNH/GDSL hydrolase family protein [Alphaproteobacteria bacterium]
MAWRGVLCAVAALTLVGCASPSSEDDEFLYLAVGASDAVGVGATPLTNGYVYLIADELEDRGQDVQLLNLGIPGADVTLIENAVRAALRTGLQPDLVTIWVGANDVIEGDDADDFETRLANMLDQLRDRTSAFIVIANLPDLTELPRFEEDPISSVTRERIRAFNNAIEDQADEYDVPVVDLAGEEVEDRYVSDVDGFHPSDAGHRRLAELFLEVILPEVVTSGHLRPS